MSCLGTWLQFPVHRYIHRKELSPDYGDETPSWSNTIFLLIQKLSVWKFRFWKEKGRLTVRYPRNSDSSLCPLSPFTLTSLPFSLLSHSFLPVLLSYDLSTFTLMPLLLPPPLLLSLLWSAQFFLLHRWCGSLPSIPSEHYHWCSIRPCLLNHSPKYPPSLPLFALLLLLYLLFMCISLCESVSLDPFLIVLLKEIKQHWNWSQRRIKAKKVCSLLGTSGLC